MGPILLWAVGRKYVKMSWHIRGISLVEMLTMWLVGQFMFFLSDARRSMVFTFLDYKFAKFIKNVGK